MWEFWIYVWKTWKLGVYEETRKYFCLDVVDLDQRFDFPAYVHTSKQLFSGKRQFG